MKKLMFVFLTVLLTFSSWAKNSIEKQTDRNATLYIACDNMFTVWLNGEKIGSHNRWEDLKKYPITISEGDILSIQATDFDDGDHHAGIYCCIVLEDTGKILEINKNWYYSSKEQKPGWKTSKKSLKQRRCLSPDNIASAHRDRVKTYEDEIGKTLHGYFVWSKNPDKTIYIKEVIHLYKFK